MPKFKTHIIQFLILASLMTGSLLLFTHYNHNQVIQFWIATGTVGCYITWGITHHYTEKRLTWEVASEYLLLGCFVIAAFKLVLQV